MGNKQPTNNSNVVLITRTQHVIIHHAYKMQLQLDSLETFPHGLDGLRLWEAGIVLSRYIVHHSHLFKDKKVLQLGSGVGIAGIAAKKWTQASQVQMTDYHPKVLQNIQLNAAKNQAICPVFNLNWTVHPPSPKQYDIIIASDVVYFGSPVSDLYALMKQRLALKGIVILVIPFRKNYASLFVQQIKKDQFDLQIQMLEQEQYFQSPLENSQEGFKKYPLLKEIKFEVYKLTRK